MPTEVILPRVDMDMTTGRVSRWYVEEGAAVRKGEPLFEIETDKAAMEVESPADGVLGGIVAAVGVDIPVGDVIAWIFAEGETAPEAPAADGGVAFATEAAPPRQEPAPEPEPAATPRASEGGSADGATLRATPLARRLARQNGVDLATLSGAGPRGRIVSADVLAHLEGGGATPSPTQAEAAARPAPASIAPSERGTLHRRWLRTGTGAPLVLLHGFGSEMNGWRPLLASLPTGRPLLGVDLPGHGASPYRGERDVRDLAAVVAGAIEAEGLAGFDLAGHSLGGAVATLLAAESGLPVRSLMLLAPAGLGPDIDGAFLAGFLRARSVESLAPWMLRLVHRDEDLRPAFVGATLAARTDPGCLEGQEALRAALFPDGTQAFSVRAALSGLRCPVKVIVGAEDRIIPARHAAGLPGRIALHRFDGVGHLPHVEAHAEVAQLCVELARSAG